MTVVNLGSAFSSVPSNSWVAVGFVAGLIPCPLTLFMMVLAVTLGIPQAGVAFAGAMAIGVLLTLTVVALATVLARGTVTLLMERFGASINSVARIFDGLAGCLLITVALA
ncbi:MAG: sulfite exporter TauE/SafE family protein [Bauldia sp.]